MNSIKVFSTTYSFKKDLLFFAIFGLILCLILKPSWMIILIIVFAFYVNLWFLTTRFIGFTDKFIIEFPSRFMNKKYCFEIENIENIVLYKSLNGRFSFPTLKIKYLNKTYTFSFAKPSNKEFENLIEYLNEIPNSKIEEKG